MPRDSLLGMKLLKDPTGEPIFVGRGKEVAAFRGAVERKFGDWPERRDTPGEVLLFHGDAGIGKSALLERLAEEFRDWCGAEGRDLQAEWGLLDFSQPQSKQVYRGLVLLRNDFRRRGTGMAFPIFDLAAAIVWKMNNPEGTLPDKSFAYWDGLGAVGTIIDILGGFGTVGATATVGKVITRLVDKVQDNRIAERLEELWGLPYCRPFQAEALLPGFFARDVRRHIEEYKRPPAIFCDTLEALHPDDFTRASTSRWAIELVEELPEVLWVMAGRNKPQWRCFGIDWPGGEPEPHSVEKLDDKAIDEFFDRFEVAHTDIREHIVTAAKGITLFYIFAAYTYRAIREKEDREPTVEDIGSTRKEILGRYLQNLDQATEQTLRVVSAARRWDYDLFGPLVKQFNTGYSIAEFEAFRSNWFVEPSAEEGRCELHDSMREHLQAYQSVDSRQRVHEFLREYYQSQFRDVEVKDMTPAHGAALTEAFYHAENALLDGEGHVDVAALDSWFWPAQSAVHGAAQWSLLEPLYLHLQQLLERELPANDARLARMANNLAGLYEAQGRYKKAEPLYKRAIEIGEKTLGKEHPDAAIWYNNLAGLYEAQGRYKKAEPLYKKAIEIGEKTLGKEHPEVATRYNNLAGLYYAQGAQGHFKEAEPLYKRAIEIGEKTLGKEHPEVATRYNNLALLYKAQGRYAEAEPLYKRANEIGEKTLGKEHPDAATWYSNLAGLYEAQGHFKEAEPLYRRANEINKKALGENHPRIATGLNNLAGLYEAQGHFKEAEPLYKKAIEVFEAALPKDHPHLAILYRNVAGFYAKTNRSEQAREYFARAEAVYEARGETPPWRRESEEDEED